MFFKKKIEAEIENEEILKITFNNDNNYSVSFYNFGGYIDSICIPYQNNLSKFEDVLLGYKNFQGYVKDQSYFNCIVGRVCGRISNAKFNLNDKQYLLFANHDPHHLHGGKIGFNKKLWKIESLYQTNDKLECVLKYTSLHLEEGYPGNLDCVVSYTLNNKNEFIIDIKAVTDEDTVVNLTNHNYWNFHGHNKYYQNIMDHYIEIKATNICELYRDNIPSGKLLDVKKTKYDFLKYKIIDENVLSNKGIDNYYCINDYDTKIKEIVNVYSDKTKMGLSLYSNQPGIQFYTGNMMKQSYQGKYKRNYGYQHGLCFEPQSFPDSINNQNFKSFVLKKDEKYHSLIIMRLKNDF